MRGTKKKQPKTITAETHPDALWTYIIDLDTAGVEGLRNKPSAAETYESQTYDHVQIPLEITGDSHARVKRFTTSLLKLYCRFNAKNGTGEAFATNKDECGSPPTLPGQHQLYSGHHHHVFEPVAGQYVANKAITRPQLGSTIAGVLEKPQEKSH